MSPGLLGHKTGKVCLRRHGRSRNKLFRRNPVRPGNALVHPACQFHPCHNRVQVFLPAFAAFAEIVEIDERRVPRIGGAEPHCPCLNSVHGSDSDENAKIEINYFFKPEEIVG